MKRAPLKRRSSKRLSKAALDVRKLWRERVLEVGGYRCAVGPSYCSGPLQCHHILPKRVLRREGHEDRFWAVPNGLVLCEFHHMSHENRSRVVPAAALSQEAWSFARDLGLDWWLERFYADDNLSRGPVSPWADPESSQAHGRLGGLAAPALDLYPGGERNTDG